MITKDWLDPEIAHKNLTKSIPKQFRFPRIEPKDAAFFAYSWKLPAYSGAFLLTVDKFSLFTYSRSFFPYSFSFFTYSWSFFAYSASSEGLKGL